MFPSFYFSSWRASDRSIFTDGLFTAALPIPEQVKAAEDKKQEQPSRNIQDALVEAGGSLGTDRFAGETEAGFLDTEPERNAAVNALGERFGGGTTAVIGG